MPDVSGPEDVANPFAAPEAAEAIAPGTDLYGYEAPRTAVVGGLYACAVVNTLTLIPIIAMNERISDPMSLLDGSPLAIAYLATSMLGGLIFYVTVVLWARWVMRAARNLRAFSPDGYFAFTPGSHVWWYIVPFLSLWKPLEGMREIETVSLMSADIADVPRTSPVGIWWALWIGQIFMSMIVSWSNLWWMMIAGGLTAASAALAAARVVKYINRLQEARATR
jgi:hypothetical protein